jgi:putative phosphoribosyl transferase
METLQSRAVSIPTSGAVLDGDLTVPAKARGVILFAHGSGSSRHSPRNQKVASMLVNGGFGTLLFDLLTPEEEIEDERTAALRFDVPMLAERLVEVTDWAGQHKGTHGLGVGYFGASTGAAAALVAASERQDAISAVVSRGGRPDLAGPALARVRAATLLIVGGADEQVIRLNEIAYADLRGVREIQIVPGATHLFEERGALDEVARLALGWFQRYL